MRTPEEIAKEIVGCYCDEAYKSRNIDDPNCPIHSFAVEEAIKIAQTEAWNEAVEACAENAEIEYAKTSHGPYVFVDKQSILKLKR